MRIVSVEAGHILGVRPVEFRWEEAPVEVKPHAERLAESGPGWSLVTNDGEVVAVAGVEILGPGVGKAYAFIGREVLGSAAARMRLLRVMKRWLPLIANRHALHLIVAWVRDDFTPGVKLARWLGFVDDGSRMAGYRRFSRRFR